MINVQTVAAEARHVPDIMRIRLAVRENAISAQRLAQMGITASSIVEMMRESHIVRCAVVADTVVGFGMAVKSSGRIFALFVQPQWQGHGIGSQLLGELTDGLAALGHTQLVLNTGPHTRACEFYVRHGWRRTGVIIDGDERLELSIPSAPP